MSESQADTVILYSKPGCGQCVATERAFKKKNITYAYKSLLEDENIARIKELGYLGAPVVETSRDHWTGYNADKIESIR